MCVYYAETLCLDGAKYSPNLIMIGQKEGKAVCCLRSLSNSKVYRFSLHNTVCDIQSAATCLGQVFPWHTHTQTYQIQRTIFDTSL